MFQQPTSGPSATCCPLDSLGPTPQTLSSSAPLPARFAHPPQACPLPRPIILPQRLLHSSHHLAHSDRGPLSWQISHLSCKCIIPPLMLPLHSNLLSLPPFEPLLVFYRSVQAAAIQFGGSVLHSTVILGYSPVCHKPGTQLV